ncbi:hypothetical protein [Streptomyces sp. NBC_01207]|uniref:hypothetical protein n=1 Tax=Streptomyces sp. NBC_01207 TaxID=2903772 RepID=UPI002E1509F2|nr:hypothetical protein OG457_27550 [Streptomyces sp. NBC_01207]
MAVRGMPTSRIPGNPMAGVLRDLNRAARRSRRRPRPEESESVDGAPTPPPRGDRRAAALWSGPAATIAATDANGMASWRFPLPFEVPPVIGALPFTRGVIGRGEALTVSIEDVSPEAVIVRVWRITSDSVLVAPAGVAVHLTAVRGPAVPLG